MPFPTFPQLHLLFPSGNSELKEPGFLDYFSVVSGHPAMFAKHLETWDWLDLCICADQISSKGVCSQINTSMSGEMYPVDPEAHRWCGKRGGSCISLQESPEKREYFDCGVRRATVLAKSLPKLCSRAAPASREYCSYARFQKLCFLTQSFLQHALRAKQISATFTSCYTQICGLFEIS